MDTGQMLVREEWREGGRVRSPLSLTLPLLLAGDAIGAALALAGVGVAWFWPRGKAAA
jgi:hypothetical protein